MYCTYMYILVGYTYIRTYCMYMYILVGYTYIHIY